jgi:hypothetical protein
MRYAYGPLLGGIMVAWSSMAAAGEDRGSHPFSPASEMQAIPLPPDGRLNDVGRDVKVINQTNFDLCVAIVEASPLRSRGWWRVANGTDQTFYSINHMYVVICGGTRYWTISPDRGSFCRSDSKFDYYTPDNPAACAAAGGTMADYYRVPDGAGVYEWTLVY